MWGPSDVHVGPTGDTLPYISNVCCVQEMKVHSYNNSVSFPPWCLYLLGLDSVLVAIHIRQTGVAPCTWSTPALYIPPYLQVNYPFPYNISSAETCLPSAVAQLQACLRVHVLHHQSPPWTHHPQGGLQPPLPSSPFLICSFLASLYSPAPSRNTSKWI